MRELAPDVLTGWNFIDFDLRVLEKIARRVRARLELGRGREQLRLQALAQPVRAGSTPSCPAGWWSTASSSCAARS